MRKTVFAAFLGTVILAAGPVVAGNSETRVYDREGRYQGHTSVNSANPQQRSVYDEHGSYKGRLMTDPSTGETRAYDAHGRYLGRTTGGRMPEPRE